MWRCQLYGIFVIIYLHRTTGWFLCVLSVLARLFDSVYAQTSPAHVWGSYRLVRTVHRVAHSQSLCNTHENAMTEYLSDSTKITNDFCAIHYARCTPTLLYALMVATQRGTERTKEIKTSKYQRVQSKQTSTEKSFMKSVRLDSCRIETLKERKETAKVPKPNTTLSICCFHLFRRLSSSSFCRAFRFGYQWNSLISRRWAVPTWIISPVAAKREIIS